jgi:sphingolipid delta-4 desaturase
MQLDDNTMGGSSRHDYYWSFTDEPHASRRKEILAKYPQIRELYGHDPNTKYIVLAWVLSQFAFAYWLRNSNWSLILMVAWCYGAFATQALALAMHEISHNLAFSKPLYNRMIGVFANLATTAPHFSMFQRYHMEHHRFQGVDGIDVDIPTRWEGEFFTNAALKMLWVAFQPAFYVFRPLIIRPKDPTFWEYVNWSCVISADIAIYYFIGGKALAYLFISIFFGSGFHPIAGHFIAEHYVFVKGQETYSYYGPLNFITFNVGYHNEHHDFPRVPGSRLAKVKEIASEYYDTLPSYNSWTKVIFDYVTDPTVGPFSRVMRKSNRATHSDEVIKEDE